MNLKKLLPYEHYTLTTRLSADQIAQRLSKKVGLRNNTTTSIFSTRNTIFRYSFARGVSHQPKHQLPQFFSATYYGQY